MAIGTGAAILGGAVLGGVGSAIGGSKAAKASKSAARAQESAAREANALQRDMFYTARDDSQPYANLGAVSSPLLQYMATGIMPEMTPQELQLIEQYNTGAQPAMMPSGNALQQTQLTPLQQRVGMEQPAATQTTEQPEIDQYSLANALAKQKAINALSGGWSIQTSPAFEWQKDQTMRGLNRQAAARGLLGSSAALNAQGNALNALVGSEFDRSYGRLMDLTNIGRGTQTTNAGLGQNFAANTGNALIGGARAAAPFTSQAGQITGSMYANAANALGYGLGNMFNQPAAPETVYGTNYYGGGYDPRFAGI